MTKKQLLTKLDIFPDDREILFHVAGFDVEGYTVMDISPNYTIAPEAVYLELFQPR